MTDTDDKFEEKIYSNFVDNEFEDLDLPLKQARWGAHSVKPEVQYQFEEFVAKSVAEIIDEGVVAAADSDLEKGRSCMTRFQAGIF